MTEFGVYAIVFQADEAERIYIGSTTQPFHKRWNAHQSLLRRGIHFNSYLQNIWNKYGIPEFRILEVCYDPEKVAICEQNWIDNTDPSILINLGPAVPSMQFGKHISIEHREKISKAQRGIKETPEVRLRMSRMQLGKKHSQKTREKMSRSRMGHPGYIPTSEERAKMAIAQTGKKHSLETKERMSLSRRKYLTSNPEVIEELSTSMKGNKHALGNKNRLGKKLSAEQSAKLSQMRKGRIPWNKGKPWSQTQRESYEKSRKIKLWSEVT
jgi:group I intron endonuclease